MSPMWFVVAWHFAMRLMFPWLHQDKKKEDRE